MNVIDLGQTSFRKSGVAQALDSYKTVRDTQINQQNADTQQKEQESLAAYRPQEIAAKKSELAIALAKMEKEEQQKNFDNGYKLLTDMSNKADTFPDESMKKMWEQSEGYKELTKVVKKYLGPEFISEDGTVNYVGKQTRVEDQLKRIEGQLVQRIQAVGEAGLTQQEKDLAKYLKNPGTEAIAKVYTAILEDPAFLDAQDKGDTEGMKSIVNKYKNQVFGEGQAVDSSDPLGLKKHA